MTPIVIAVSGILVGLVIAGIIYWLCLRDGNGSRTVNEEVLEDIAIRARSIRRSSEDIETRVARLQELRRIRERVSQGDRGQDGEGK